MGVVVAADQGIAILTGELREVLDKALPLLTGGVLKRVAASQKSTALSLDQFGFPNSAILPRPQWPPSERVGSTATYRLDSTGYVGIRWR